ncbi:hypothetical protein L2E82_39974 [Cichorium intybus]|uniref:Uncharacterized protein n=1 Tax=Cichorium intybus TaxID=13427 RepID=A0ACB9AP36_CICIN|nr:hypothetical protein L2E82_39974 [Cichorium intybus]
MLRKVELYMARESNTTVPKGVFYDRKLVFKKSSGSLTDLDETQRIKEPDVGTSTQSEVVKPVETQKEMMESEMKSMYDNQVWNLVDQTPDLKTVGCKWVFKKKTDVDERILFVIAAFYDYEIWQMDVKTAFLKGKLSEDVYMTQLEGFVQSKYPNRVCKLVKSIYGLKQASRSWNLCFDEKIKEFGFSRSKDESCVYVGASGSIEVYPMSYTDSKVLM